MEEKENVNSQAYTNRELYMLIERNNDFNLEAHQNMLDKMEGQYLTLLSSIEKVLAQATKTNGRVNGLELREQYRLGQVWMVPMVVGAVVSGIVALLFNYFK